MHEFSIAMSLIDAIERKAKEVGATRVLRVKLRIGMATTVVPEFMREAFDVAKIGTVAEDASLEMEFEPIVLSCWNCGQKFKAVSLFEGCPSCGNIGGRVVSGDQLIVERLELEVRGRCDESTRGSEEGSFDA